MEQEVSAQFPLAQLSASELHRRLTEAREALLFDVRSPTEYAVSHLPGAIRVDPQMDLTTFIARYGPQLEGRPAIFYCAVGVRSSTLAARLKEYLIAWGSSGVYNLQGGIFRWHNEERPLVNQGGETAWVHGFNDHWGQLIRRGEWLDLRPIP